MNKRVRTGCVTCRRRRMKCDETKPTCNRCRNANFMCGGYEQPQLVTPNPFVPTTSVVRKAPSRAENLQSDLSWRHHSWRQEQLPLFHHFITTTAVRLFRVDHVTFWRDQVAQMSYGVDIVYEALLAIGAVHRSSLIAYQKGNYPEAVRFKVLGFDAYGRALEMLPGLLVNEESIRTILLFLLYCCFWHTLR